MSATIVIAGAGQLGSRYLQGMANCRNTLDIYVQDISEQSLQIAKQRWEQVFNTVSPSLRGVVIEAEAQHKVTFLSSFEKIPRQIDIAIVATNADVRSQVVKQIVTNCEVRYWVLEKVLAQSEMTLDEISSLTQNSTGAWINIPRRMMDWQKQIQKNLPNEVSLCIKGSVWGLACNGIHFLDLVAWWTGERFTQIDYSELDSQWIESKRKGFFDIAGKITAAFSGGTTLSLESRLDGPPSTMVVEAQGEIWEIDEQNGFASGPDGVLITGNNEMQSSMTSRLVDCLLTEGHCDLTKLHESIEIHRVFLRSLLEHWNYTHGTNVDVLPIT